MKILKSLVVCITFLIAQNAMASFVLFEDANELDFDGNFDYAINFHGTGTQQVGDAAFTNVEEDGSGLPSGVVLTGFDRDFNWRGGSNLGAGADNDALEQILQSLIWSQSIAEGFIDLDIIAGNGYRLQLLFSEGFSNNRNYTVNAEGILDESVVGVTLNSGSFWRNSSTQGYAMILDFVATDNVLNINMGRLQGGDTNYHISGLTLEKVPSPQVISLLLLGLAVLSFARIKKQVSTNVSTEKLKR